MPNFSLMLSRYKFNQIKVKTKFFNGSPASVYQRSEVIECLRLSGTYHYSILVASIKCKAVSAFSVWKRY